MVHNYKEEIILTDDLTQIPLEDGRTKHILFIICNEGMLQCRVENIDCSLSPRGLLACRPGARLSGTMISPHWSGSILCFNSQSFAQIMYVSKQIWTDIQYVVENPVMELTEDEYDIFIRQWNALLRKVSGEESPYRKEIIHCLTSCLVLEIMAAREKSLPTREDGRTFQQADNLTKHFLEIVTEEGGRIRSVAEVAERLHVTPKYLSFLVKKQTGENAYSHIRNATFQGIQNRLLYTGMSIKEIAAEFNFPSLSFFGKFVKDCTGMSPTQYRQSNDVAR